MTNVGYATLQVVPTAKGFKSALEKEVGGPLAAVGGSSGKAAGEKAGKGLMGGLMPVVGKLAPVVAGAFAAASAGSFLKDSVAAASDLNETLAKTGQIFGNATPAITAFADSAGSAFGQTKQQALDAAATFGIFGKSAGLTGPELSKFSTGLAGLASDMASFSNTDVETAITSLSAALRGESEPIRQFGVLLDEDTLKATALEKGIVSANVNMDKVAKSNKAVAEAQRALNDATRKYGADSAEAAAAQDYLSFKQAELGKALKGTVDKLTPQQRVLAAQAAIYAQTGDAQGDFARTSQGLANQQRILSAAFGNLKSTVGQAFLPIVTSLVQLANRALPPIISFAEKLKPFGENVVGFFRKLFDGASQGEGAVGPLVKVFGGVMDAVKQALPAFAAIGTTVAGTLGPALVSLGQFMRDRILPAFVAFGGFVARELLPRIIGMYQTLATNLLPVFRSIGEAIATRIIPALKRVAEGVLGFVESIKPLMTFLVRLAGVIVGVLSKALGFIIPIILKIAGPIFSFLISVIVKVIGWLGKIIGWVGSFGNKLLDSGASVSRFTGLVADKMGSIIRFFVDMPGKIVRAVGGLGKTLFGAGKDLVQGLIDGAGSLLSKVGNFFLDKLPGWIRTPFKKALGIASPSKVFAGFGVNIGEGLVKGLGSQTGSVRSAVRGLSSTVTGAFDGGLSVSAQMPASPSVGAAGASGAGAFAPVINNYYPEPERASDALPVSLRRAAFAAGF